MEQNEGLKPAANESPADEGTIAASLGSRREIIPHQQSEVGSCPTCGRMGALTSPPYVYTICQIEPRFPHISLQKEFAQATGRIATAGLTDRQALYETLKQNRYLVRQLCWVASIKAVDTYILVLDDPSLVEELIESVNPNSDPMNKVNVVIGVRGPIAPPEMCNGLILPIVRVVQIYAFNRDAFFEAIPRPQKISEEQFKASAEQVFDQIMQMTENAGMGKYRALNYVAARYDRPYVVTYEAFQQNKALSKVEALPSSLSGSREIFDVFFIYTDRKNSVTTKYKTSVGVSGLFPYLEAPLLPTYDR